MQRLMLWAVAVAASFLLAVPAVAAEPLGAGVSASATVVGGADFDDRDGGYSVAQGKASASYGIVRLTYALRSYDWDDAAGLPFGNGVDDPWDELHSLELTGSDSGFFDESWGWFWLAGVSSGFEEEMDGSFGASAGGGLIRVLDADWAVRFGLMGFAHPIGAKVLPSVSLDWRARADEGFSASIGVPETYLALRFDPRWAARLSAGLETGLWRLADDSTVDPEGYASEMALRIGLYGLWSPVESLDVKFGPEVRFMRSVTLYNDEGDKRSTYDLDSAAGFAAGVSWRF